MAAIVFDVRSAERRLKAAGASEELAEATADLMSQAVLLNLDALVTKDYLDARLDARFSELEVKFKDIDARFRVTDGRIDSLRAELESKIDSLRTELASKIDSLRTELKSDFRLVHAMLAILMAGVFIPQLQAWFGG